MQEKKQEEKAELLKARTTRREKAKEAAENNRNCECCSLPADARASPVLLLTTFCEQI